MFLIDINYIILDVKIIIFFQTKFFKALFIYNGN